MKKIFNSNFNLQIPDLQTGVSLISRSERGFTLIELILYVVMVSIMLAALIPFAWNVIEGSTKSVTEQEVYSQARYLSERIKKEIRDSSGVNTCSGTTISLSNATAAKNPTVFAFASSAISITQGTIIPSAIRLHSLDTQITSFSCTNYTSGDNKTRNIQFTFTLTDNISSTRQEFAESISVQGSTEVRSIP